MKVSIIIPAYNEEKRIESMVKAYSNFFNKKNDILNYELLVVINGTTDNTKKVIENLQQEMPNLLMQEIKEGGKGLAISYGFKNALERPNDLIGFVDADMATSPEAFFDLITNCNFDGVIASRYMSGSVVTPPRPFIKKWGSKIFFSSLVKLLFGLNYYDTQCGAKLFTKKVINSIAPHLYVKYWAFDVEILYLCKRYGFCIREIPTIWNDQAGSKLSTFSEGIPMLTTLIALRWYYLFQKKAI